VKWLRFSPLPNILSSVVVGGVDVEHAKSKSMSEPEEVKLTNPGVMPVTVSLIQFWYSDTRA